MTYRVLSLFAGIGGFDLGLERTGGFKTVAFAETDPYASRVLSVRWPDVPNLGDVEKAEYPDADFICAGFPCQDISFAGAGAGLAGARSGLWREVVRAIRVVRPRGVLLENVAALLGRGLDRVLGDLAEVGHDAEWHCIPAASVGAPHIRDRIWIYCNPNDQSQSACAVNDEASRLSRSPIGGYLEVELADAARVQPRRTKQRPQRKRVGPCGQPFTGADAARGGWQGAGHVEGQGGQAGQPFGAAWWFVEPAVGRVAHGVPSRVDRLRCLGNAVVPQIPELIGRAILAADAERLAA